MEREQKCFELHRSGYTSQQIANQLGVRKGFVLQILEEAGLSPHRKAGRAQQMWNDPSFQDMLTSEATQDDIAASLGVTATAISLLLKRRGYKRVPAAHKLVPLVKETADETNNYDL